MLLLTGRSENVVILTFPKMTMERKRICYLTASFKWMVIDNTLKECYSIIEVEAVNYIFNIPLPY